MSDNVIHLAFRSPHVDDDSCAMMACKNCRNKTFLMLMDQMDTFPMMKCAACDQHIGRMGWTPDADPMLSKGDATS